MRLPLTGLTAEYRGQAPASEFTARDSGERIDLAPNYRFEVELPDGDVDVVSFRRPMLDEAADFDVASLKKGDVVTLEGTVVLDNGDGKRSYLRLHALRRVEPGKLRAAS